MPENDLERSDFRCAWAAMRFARFDKAIEVWARLNLDGRALGCVDVAALPDGDSAFGCRQMLGNVWEWTADTFHPFPGFEPDSYKEYSTDLFWITKVLRGGAWTTRSRMIQGTHRNYFSPDRLDVFSGFRTCYSL